MVKKSDHCNRNTLLPYSYERTCMSCGYNVIKRKHELSKCSKKRKHFIDRLNYAERKNFCICIDVYTIYEGEDYDKIFEVLSTLNNKKSKINNILNEK